MREEAAFEEKSADGEFISSDMAPADNWSQSSPSSENSQVECSSEKIDQSVNPFAPEAQLFVKASVFQPDSEQNSGGDDDMVSFVEIESYENLRKKVERKTRELLLAQRSLTNKESEVQQIIDET